MISAINSSGRSGGIGIFWKDEIKVEVIGFSQYHVDVIVENLAEIKFRAMFVYGEAQVNKRYKTWNTLRGIVNVSNLPWMAMGDFNEVIHAREHDGVG